ncbi:MAG: acyl transferase, partial [Chitinophagales bacterium]|nr:acyl transferase [Chitinophagales bacterium]
GSQTSKHPVADLNLYIESLKRCFELFYGDPEDYCILALLPSYAERGNSSLVFMIQHLMFLSGHSENGFFLHDFDRLAARLASNELKKQKTIFIGVAYALLDFAERYPMKLRYTMVMETGGMKGRRKEMTRYELHEKLSAAFGVENIHSEYGMTELLSQAYSKGKGLFKCPPWMKVLIRNVYNPLETGLKNKPGGINVIDLANIYSCSFIATDDWGIVRPDEMFEVLGRLDNSDQRGCSLLYFS